VPQHNVPALAGRNIRCILFDLGNTLWTYKDNTTRLAQEQVAQQQVIAILHQHVDPHFFPFINKKTFTDQLFEAIEQHMYVPRPDMRDVPDIIGAVIVALQTLGFPSVERSVAEEVYEILRDSIPGTRSLFEDTLTTLTTLQERGFLLNIVSNRDHGGALFREGMHEVGLQTYFDPQKIAISIDLGSSKPDAYIFQYALNALDIAPEEAVMIGDALGADVVGAKHLNIASVWKPLPRLFAQARAIQKQEQMPQAFESILLQIGYENEQKRGRPIPEDIVPDLIIEHLSELLNVFVEVGQQ